MTCYLNKAYIDCRGPRATRDRIHVDMGRLCDGIKITNCGGKKDKNAIELPRSHSRAGEAVLRVGRVGDGAEEDAFEISLGEGKKGKKGEVCPVTFGQSAATGSGRSLTPRQAHLLTLSAPPAHLDRASVTATPLLFLRRSAVWQSLSRDTCAYFPPIPL